MDSLSLFSFRDLLGLATSGNTHFEVDSVAQWALVDVRTIIDGAESGAG